MKDKIKELEEELRNARIEIERYKNNVYYNYMETDAYKLNVSQLERLEKENMKLKADNKKLKAENKKIKEEIKEKDIEIQKLKDEKSQPIEPVRNARGAGRKTKLDDKKDEIKHLRSQGMKIAELAAKYNCSVGKIHKLINE